MHAWCERARVAHRRVVFKGCVHGAIVVRAKLSPMFERKKGQAHKQASSPGGRDLRTWRCAPECQNAHNLNRVSLVVPASPWPPLPSTPHEGERDLNLNTQAHPDFTRSQSASFTIAGTAARVSGLNLNQGEHTTS